MQIYFTVVTIMKVVEAVVRISREDFEVSLHPYKTTAFPGSS